MKYIGDFIQVKSGVKGIWHVQKVIIDGYSTPKWAVFHNGVHVGTERLKKHAVIVCREMDGD